MKKNDIVLFIIGIFYAVIGIILLTNSAENILKFIFVVLGVLAILFNSLIAIDAITKIKKEKSNIIILILALVQIVLGIFVIVTQSKTLLIVTGAILLSLSALAILAAKDKKEQFKLEISKLSLGIIFIVLGATDAAKYVFIALGIVSLIFGAMYLIMALLMSILKDEIESDENSIYKDGRIITK